MGIASTLAEGLLGGLKSAIPELADRGTAESPAVLNEAKVTSPIGTAVRAPEVPYKGLPSSEAAIRAEIPPRPGVMQALRDGNPEPIKTGVRNLKNMFASVFRADPSVPKDVQKKFYNGRVRANAAQDVADLDVRDAFSPMKTDPKSQATLLNDFMVESDNVATAQQQGVERVSDGRSLQEAQANLAALWDHVKNDPETSEAHSNIRAVLDHTFDDMVERGYIQPDRYREHYTPREMLTQIAQGLATSRGEKITSQKLMETLGRSSNVEGLRRTNVLDLLREHLGHYYRKTAEDDMLSSLLDDPTLNVTSHFKDGDPIPEGLGVYRPGPGMPGYAEKEAPHEMADGIVDGLGADKYTGGHVLPKPVVTALENFRNKIASPTERNVFRYGNAWARQMTVYAPRNTFLNLLSDYPVALMGIPGEKSRAMGIIRFTPQAIMETLKGVYGQGSPVFDMARREGLTSSTIATDVRGAPVSHEFSQYGEEPQLGPGETIKDAMRRFRQSVETAPRIAAGLEALARTDNISEFGRAGRMSTLPYGAGAPAVARSPALRFIAPFVQFIGLASDRVFSMMTTEGSRGRMIAGLVAVPTAAAMWNYKNDDFRKVEESLPDFERAQMHVIAEDPKNPGKPLLDRTGKPVVLHFRYWVPEEVAKTFGLGNMPSRLYRVAQGRDKWTKVIQDIPEGMMGSAAGQVGPLGTAISFADTKNKFTGKDQPFSDKLWNLLPNFKAAHEAYLGYKNKGIGEAAKRAGEELAGISFANVTRRGKAVLDADLIDAQRAIKDARSEYRSRLLKGDTARAGEARQRMMDAIDDLRRVAAARAAEGK